ncbi:hypothetical protein B0A50_03701 [Salinomyces thailandicus]|uniref:Uncharacterized protein n=1 Tax=Salinomyces thailandicus TaxID=706561 RepID=A0A4U0U2H7_9PEZI|nr:hypothetical protein B0A50_03701 [Salinomyces thailandica]
MAVFRRRNGVHFVNPFEADRTNTPTSRRSSSPPVSPRTTTNADPSPDDEDDADRLLHAVAGSNNNGGEDDSDDDSHSNNNNGGNENDNGNSEDSDSESSESHEDSDDAADSDDSDANSDSSMLSNIVVAPRPPGAVPRPATGPRRTRVLGPDTGGPPTSSRSRSSSVPTEVPTEVDTEIAGYTRNQHEWQAADLAALRRDRYEAEQVRELYNAANGLNPTDAEMRDADMTDAEPYREYDEEVVYEDDRMDVVDIYRMYVSEPEPVYDEDRRADDSGQVRDEDEDSDDEYLPRDPLR